MDHSAENEKVDPIPPTGVPGGGSVIFAYALMRTLSVALNHCHCSTT